MQNCEKEYGSGKCRQINSYVVTDCLVGFEGIGGLCVQTCPANFTDSGDYCLKQASYVRKGFQIENNSTDALSSCEFANGENNCEIYGDSYFPKCINGFTKSGCCVW